ncbi:hypothetical protein FC699_17255, partial [Bacillus wiedmannii]
GLKSNHCFFLFKSRGIASIFENPHAKSIQKFIQFSTNPVTNENPKTRTRSRFPCQSKGPVYHSQLYLNLGSV